MFNNNVTQSDLLAVDASFQFVAHYLQLFPQFHICQFLKANSQFLFASNFSEEIL